MKLLLPDHELHETLRHDADQRRSVWRGRVAGEPCVTRILHVPVDPALDGVVRRAALEGRGRLTGLHRDLEAVLEGYRVLAGLGGLPALPEVLAAGVALDAEDPTAGYPFVSARWVEGESLDEVLEKRTLGQADAEGLLIALLRLLAALHERGVAFGDVKPSNFVLTPSGRLALIDPDTLRQVPPEPGFVLVHDRTPEWAPPELREHPPRLTLGSDLYSFGLVCCQVLVGARPGQPGFAMDRLPPRWRRLVEACLLADPARRPAAGQALLALSAPEGKERQPPAPVEPTVRVPEPVHPPPALPLGAPPAPPRGGARLWWAGGLLLLGLAMAGAGVATWALIRTRDAERAADRAWEDLRAYKTDWTRNTDAELAAVVAEAQGAVALWPTARALGLEALVRVWAERWHYVASARPWDADAFAATLAVVEQAEAAGETLEARAARGVLLAGACRKMPDAEASLRRSRCEEAIRALETAEALAEGEPWLALELAWNRVMALAALAQTAGEAEARALRGRALAACQSARGRLAEAPVNGWYLASECLELAGAQEEVRNFLDWADWLQEEAPARERRAGDASEARVARQITRATHPDCAELAVRRDGTPDLRASSCAGDRADLCRGLALAALGCNVPLWRGCVREQEGLPWAEVDQALRDPLHGPCPGEYDLGDLPSAAVRIGWGGWFGLSSEEDW